LNKFERYLEKNAPEHLEGYRKGWLDINTVEFANHYFHHIFSAEKVIGTLVEH